MKKALYILFVFSSVCFGQISKDDIRQILILEGYRDGIELQAQADLLYISYLDKISFKGVDLAEGVGYSFLSG